MKAKDKQEFEIVWMEHLAQLGVLGFSLPNDKVQEFFQSLKELRKYVKIASKHVFGEFGDRKE